MTWINYDDIVEQLQTCGFDLSSVELATRKRVKIPGNSQKGWYSLYEITLDGGDTALVGSYGWWIGGETFVHKFDLRVDKKKLTLSAEQREAVKARADAARRQAEAERARAIEAAAHKAAHWWRQLADTGSAAYLERKGFAPGKLYGARVSEAGNLVVPMQDAAGKIYGLHVIYAKPIFEGKKKRDKNFTPPGLAKKGHFFQIGLAQRGGVVLLAEGFATGASLHEATGLPVVVAFDAGNLLPVAQAIHKTHRRDIKVMVCADDDYLTEGNPGKKAAEAAAIAVDGAHCWPVFPTERSQDRKGPTDFNDLHVHPDGGLQMVARQVQEALALAGWRAKDAPLAKGAAPKGGGEGGRREACSVMPVDDLVARFVPLDDGTGKYVFDTWTNKVAHRDQMIALMPAGVRADDIKRHPVYVERGAYYLDQVGFDPAGVDDNVKLNTWRGWPMKPKAGKCEVLLQLLRYLCSEDPKADEIFRWILCWMAYPLQHPGAKMSSAIIMHGPQGTGKSTVFQTLAKIYGDYSTVLNQRGLEDKFNADWSDSKLFILAEEVVTRAEMWHIKNELKELVTGEWIRVNPKNIAAYRQRNQVNIAYLSNENQPLPIDNDDRRHLVVYTPPQLGEDFYDEVYVELEQGGVAAFYQYLLDYDTSGFHPKKRPPMTEAKVALMALASPSEQRFVLDWTGGEIGLPVCPALSMDVYAAYKRWCQANGESRPRPSNQFLGTVGRMQGWSRVHARVYKSTHYTGDTVLKRLIVPPARVLAAAGREMQPGAHQMKWHTDGVIDFANALHAESEKGAAWG